jgi:hypothetical protein
MWHDRKKCLFARNARGGHTRAKTPGSLESTLVGSRGGAGKGEGDASLPHRQHRFVYTTYHAPARVELVLQLWLSAAEQRRPHSPPSASAPSTLALKRRGQGRTVHGSRRCRRRRHLRQHRRITPAPPAAAAAPAAVLFTPRAPRTPVGAIVLFRPKRGASFFRGRSWRSISATGFVVVQTAQAARVHLQRAVRLGRRRELIHRHCLFRCHARASSVGDDVWRRVMCAMCTTFVLVFHRKGRAAFAKSA